MAITGVFPGVGLTGGGITGDVFLSLLPATSTSIGGITPGAGCEVTPAGVLNILTSSVTGVTAGEGLGAPTSGDTITTTGTIKLLPPSSDGTKLGGVKAGPNIRIEIDGQVTTENLLETNNPYAYNAYIWPAPASPIPAAPGDNGSVLTLIDRVTGEIGWTNTGTLSTVVAGTGLDVVSTATSATVSLATVPSLVSGSFGATALIPTLTVNAYGQLTSAGLANPYTPYRNATVVAPPSLVLDFDGNNTHWEWTMQDNVTFENPLNAQSGQSGYILIRQNGLVPYSVTWGAAWKFEDGIPFIGNASTGGVDMVSFTVVAANYIVVTKVTRNLA